MPAPCRRFDRTQVMPAASRSPRPRLDAPLGTLVRDRLRRVAQEVQDGLMQHAFVGADFRELSLDDERDAALLEERAEVDGARPEEFAERHVAAIERPRTGEVEEGSDHLGEIANFVQERGGGGDARIFVEP